ncbi:uncharacterized protein LOC127464748 isoform X2 [Manacus candei]|uniref:uncharacterized protein LOC127464748 isoform X2 n=1 Tax=Manacus candei TaxID=415023 RepID=UPI00222799A2|nr:uncharacterized protein LOC127464748 isoform X2 [Manacus candei]
MSELLLLTRIVPGGGGGGAGGEGGGANPPRPSPTERRRRLWGEPLALGVSQVLVGTLQVALGGSLLVALGDPVGAQLGTPLGTGPVSIVAGATLAALGKGPSKGRARAALALAVVASIVSFLALGLQGLLVAYGCPSCFHLGPPAQPVVIYQTALPGVGAGPAEATPTGDPAPQ